MVATNLWSYSSGERPNTVRVFERQRGGVLYARAWDATARGGRGNWHVRSLKHRDKKRAKRYAITQAAKLESGEFAVDHKVTVAQVFALYLEKRTPRKCKTEQKVDARIAALWTRILAGGSDPHVASLGQWESFIDARSVGAIDARGNPVPEANRKPVRARTVEYDCVWLHLVYSWAVDWRLPSGQYLMRENPVRGFEAPKEKNPRRPVATQDRFEAVRAVSDSVMMEDRRNGKREKRRAYLSELLDIVNGTGRRIRAVCELRFADVRWNEGLYGSIRWPADTDKKGYETLVPIPPAVRAALDRIQRERPGIGSVPLFPSLSDPTKAISRHLADSWLREAEALAELEPQTGSLWHAYRRKWGTERKHLPDVDVAAAGGWKSLDALKKCYQHADPATMLEVVMGAGELREVK
jgi:hypothetical protein